MSSILKSWWSGGEQSDSDKPEGEATSKEETESAGETAVSSWVKGLEGFVSSVSDYASNLKDSVTTKVQSNSFMSEFEEEQRKFERERQRQRDTAVPPWVGYNEEEKMKAQILALSEDSRNVLRNPPPGIQFHFDFAKSYPVAMALLKEDPRLQKLRFELVPKKLKEESFWHNYFYRVFLIKQSSQLSSLTSAERTATASPDATEKSGEDETSPVSLGESFTDVGHQETQGEAPSEDFASDALVVSQGEGEDISRESVRAELDQLGMQQESADAGDLNTEEWEKEIARELEDLSVEDEGVAPIGDEQWENELQQILETHSGN